MAAETVRMPILRRKKSNRFASPTVLPVQSSRNYAGTWSTNVWSRSPSGNSWALLRERIMQLPVIVAAELRDLGYDRHAVRLRIEVGDPPVLNEVADSLERITSAEDFLAGFDGDDTVAESEEVKAARERKRDAVNQKRRQKRNAKKTGAAG